MTESQGLLFSRVLFWPIFDPEENFQLLLTS